MIDPRQYLPRRRTGPGRHGSGVGAPRRERLNGQAVISGADQAFERGAFEHGVNQLAPLLAGRGGKIGGELHGFWISHGRKMPRPAASAN